MKATKVLGAVLGVLMVAALFTGAVAASDSEVNLGDVYIYKLYADDYFQNTSEAPFLISDNLNGWSTIAGDKDVAFRKEMGDTKYFIAGNESSTGVYFKTIRNKTYSINLKYPTATVNAVVYLNKDNDMSTATPISDLIGGTANTDNAISFEVPQFIGDDKIGKVAGMAFTTPDGYRTINISKGVNLTADSTQWYLCYDNIKGMVLGFWTVQAVFEKGTTNGFSTLAPDYMYGKAYPFTIISAGTTKNLVASTEEVIQGGSVTMTLTAPYGDWYVSVEEGSFPGKQPGLTPDSNTNSNSIKYAKIHVGTSGVATFIVESKSTNDMKVCLYTDENDKSSQIKKTVTIKVKAGAITANPEKDTVYIGDEIKIEGTNDLDGTLYFFIKGTNYDLEPYMESKSGKFETASGKIWDVTINTGNLKNHPDAGTYTIYIAKTNETNAAKIAESKDTDNFDTDLVEAYTTVSVGLVQPFITATAQDVVVQTGKLKIEGTAEGNPGNVSIYVFGTNFFATADAAVADDGTYTYTKKIVAPNKNDNDAWKMAAGQYFVVVQHKMYDLKYNIGPVPAANMSNPFDLSKGYNIMLNENGNYNDIQTINVDGSNKTIYNGTVIFNTNVRQSANAAEALVEAIGSQNIDDMQAHLSFIVAGPTSYVNAIPTQVTKGQALTISGTTTGHENEMVSVELLSTAFAAIPKETVGSASFTTLTTRIGEDGVWSVTFDTSNMNADDYTVSVAVGQLDAVTSKTKIVDGSTPSQPTTQPTQSQPTVAPTSAPTTAPTSTPANPGFGALAALVGLGAVAVLLLRRE